MHLVNLFKIFFLTIENSVYGICQPNKEILWLINIHGNNNPLCSNSYVLIQ